MEGSSLYDVAIMQLGTFKTHRMICPSEMVIRKGATVTSHVVQVVTKPGRSDGFLFVPLGVSPEDVTAQLR